MQLNRVTCCTLNWRLGLAHGEREKMAAASRCVREVTVFSSNQRPRLVDFTIGTTASSTKIRDEETLKCNIGGGYVYKDGFQAYSVSANRFIYW